MSKRFILSLFVSVCLRAQDVPSLDWSISNTPSLPNTGGIYNGFVAHDGHYYVLINGLFNSMINIHKYGADGSLVGEFLLTGSHISSFYGKFAISGETIICGSYASGGSPDPDGTGLWFHGISTEGDSLWSTFVASDTVYGLMSIQSMRTDPFGNDVLALVTGAQASGTIKTQLCTITNAGVVTPTISVIDSSDTPIHYQTMRSIDDSRLVLFGYVDGDSSTSGVRVFTTVDWAGEELSQFEIPGPLRTGYGESVFSVTDQPSIVTVFNRHIDDSIAICQEYTLTGELLNDFTSPVSARLEGHTLLADGTIAVLSSTYVDTVNWTDFEVVGFTPAGDELWRVQEDVVPLDYPIEIIPGLDDGFTVLNRPAFSLYSITHFSFTTSISRSPHGSGNSASLVTLSPNPANPSTTIRYSLPDKSDLTITIYDLLGRQIWKQVIDGHSPGGHQLTWDGTDTEGQNVDSGVYIIQLSTPSWTESRKVVVLR